MYIPRDGHCAHRVCVTSAHAHTHKTPSITTLTTTFPPPHSHVAIFARAGQQTPVGTNIQTEHHLGVPGEQLTTEGVPLENLYLLAVGGHGQQLLFRPGETQV